VNDFYLEGDFTMRDGNLELVGDGVSTGKASKPGGGMWIGASDERIKNIHQEFTQGLDVLLKIPIDVFSYKNNPEKNYTGIIAQKLLNVYPSSVLEKDGIYHVDPSDFIYLCMNSIKEQKIRLENQKIRLAGLEKLIK
jgi:hypothetical protein